MTRSKPAATGTSHTLPFDKLSPRDFERLCLWLVKREGFERAEHLGAAGSEQGRDIVAWREGQRWAFQCKRVQRFGPRDALTEAEKILTLPQHQRPAALVFLVTCDVSANARRQVRDRCAGEMACHFWTGTELDERVKGHPDIVEEFFHIDGGGEAVDTRGVPRPGGAAAGERGVAIGGGVSGTIITGDGNVIGGPGHRAREGGIQAGRIEAENVVDGVQMQGGAPGEAGRLVELARTIQRGGITAREIEAGNVISGLQFLSGAPPGTSDELRREVTALRRRVAQAISAGEIARRGDAQDVTHALDQAQAELTTPEPNGRRVVRNLRTAAEILTGAAETAQAARKADLQITRLALVAAVLHRSAQDIF